MGLEFTQTRKGKLVAWTKVGDYKIYKAYLGGVLACASLDAPRLFNTTKQAIEYCNKHYEDLTNGS